MVETGEGWKRKLEVVVVLMLGIGISSENAMVVVVVEDELVVGCVSWSLLLVSSIDLK